MEEKNKKRQIAKISVFITSIFVIFMSVTYAFITTTLTGTKKVVLNAGVLDLVLEEENEITISDALPMYDQVGMIQDDVFVFRLVNKTNNPTDYVLKLEKISTSNELSENDVKYYLTKEGIGTPALLSSLLDDGTVDRGTIAGKDTIDYTLRLWIDSSVTDQTRISGKSLSYKLKVDAGQEIYDDNNCKVYAETEPNKPELTSGMIAVTYNETDETWVKADTSTDDWYDYDNQIWANAVTVTKDTRDTYMRADAGEPISMEDINTMWVWIPRYSYTIMQPYGKSQKCSDLGEITLDSPGACRKPEYPSDLRSQALTVCQAIEQQYAGTSTVVDEETCVVAANYLGLTVNTFEDVIDYGISEGYLEDTRVLLDTYPDKYFDASSDFPGAIDIRFITKSEKDTGTGQYTTCTDNWVTPEGFSFGNEEIPGFWMGKFETSTLEGCTGGANDINTGCDLTTLTPQVKPNVESWRRARVSTFFEASRLMQSSDNASIYGFDVVGTSSMDTHMLKNTEWGIVAMLSQSKYGKYGNPNYIGANKEVYQNQSHTDITGMSNGTPSQDEYNTQVTYDTPDTGYGASTTGTIYGVYDMSGGAYEYVMGNYNNISGYNASFNSGFCGTNGPTENCREWPDSKYYDLYTTDYMSTGYKFGDGTYETRRWYGDDSDFVYSNYPWFIRGGYYYNNTTAGVFYSYIINGGNSIRQLRRCAFCHQAVGLSQQINQQAKRWNTDLPVKKRCTNNRKR